MAISENPDIESATDAYAARFAGAAGVWLLSRQSALVLGAIRKEFPSQPFSLLDVGGGHGQIVKVLAGEPAATMTVCSSAPGGDAQVRELQAQGRVEIDFAPLDKLPYESASFDVVTCIRQLPHFSAWENLFAELCRVSRRLVVVDYPPLLSSNLLSPLFFHLKKAAEGNTRSYRLFRHSEIDGSASKCGFNLASRHGQFLWPMVVHRLLKSPALSGALEYFPHLTGVTRLLGNPVIAAYVRKG